MDFTLDESQQAVADLANQILGDRIKPEELKAAEDSEQWLDSNTYAEIAKAGLIGIAVSEDVGGGGMGLVELGQVLQAQGAHTAPLPLWSTALGALAIDRFGTAEQRQAELPAIIDGSRILAIGIQEWHSDDYLLPAAEAVADNDSFKITGTKIVVEFAEEAEKIIVSAKNESGAAGLYLLDLNQDGISKTAGTSTRHQPLHEINMSGAKAEALPDADLKWFTNSAIALLCATQVGVCSQALKMTAEYASTREQFGRPIATFQAVTHSLADQYIHLNGIKLTAYAALWKLDNEKDADAAVHEAKWFSSHIGMEIVNSTQHIHGGMGVDRDYPLHRYTLWNKYIQTSLGAGTQQLRKLGALLASS